MCSLLSIRVCVGQSLARHRPLSSLDHANSFQLLPSNPFLRLRALSDRTRSTRLHAFKLSVPRGFHHVLALQALDGGGQRWIWGKAEWNVCGGSGSRRCDMHEMFNMVQQRLGPESMSMMFSQRWMDIGSSTCLYFSTCCLA